MTFAKNNLEWKCQLGRVAIKSWKDFNLSNASTTKEKHLLKWRVWKLERCLCMKWYRLRLRSYGSWDRIPVVNSVVVVKKI
jgi:hypothetical protein